jgi:cold-inducible RNA-binding protein
MGSRLYVGNLPYSATEEQLTELFSRAGKVDNVRVMRDMATGRARGFAFVEMATDDEAQKAITEFHEHQMDGRALVVNEARPKPEGGFGGGGGGRGRGPGGGGGYDRGGGGGGGYGGGGGKREPRW